MTAQVILQDLYAHGVILTANGNQLDIDAPDDVLTDELLATLRNHKAELLELLVSKSETPIPPLTQISGGINRAMILAAIERGECPDCQTRLDLQSKADGGTYWCAACRIFLIVSELLN